MSTNVELTEGSPVVKHSRCIERLVRTSTLSDRLRAVP